MPALSIMVIASTPASGEHCCLVGELLGGEQVRFHLRVAAGQPGGLDHLHGLDGLGSVARVGADSQEAQALILRHLHQGSVSIIGLQEHTEAGLVRVRSYEVHVLGVAERGGGTGGVSAEALGVAELYVGYPAGYQPANHAFRELRVETVADNVAAVAQCAVENIH